jgi:SAM-dependent methyltransferase
MTGDVPESADPRRIVADGYDRIAERYLAWTGPELRGQRAWCVDQIDRRVPPGRQVLELGCATGIPVTRELAMRFDVTGVDLSARQIALARENVPNAQFTVGDIIRLELPGAAFDAAIACYVFGHVPREEQAGLFRRIAGWLRPGGLFVGSLGIGDDPGTVESDWLGVPMFFSSFDAATGTRLLKEAGFLLLAAEEVTELEDGVPVTFLWFAAEKT